MEKRVSDEDVEEYVTVLGNMIAVRLLREQARHVRENSDALKKYVGAEDEARCRMLCAAYLQELADGLSSDTARSLFKMIHKDGTKH